MTAELLRRGRLTPNADELLSQARNHDPDPDQNPDRNPDNSLMSLHPPS